MGKYEQIREAMEMFGLNEHETMGEIKRKINSLIKIWHPDKCMEKGKEEMYIARSISLIEAKKIILDFCENYKISFEKDEVGKYVDPEEFWEHRFGKDPHWGNKIKQDSKS